MLEATPIPSALPIAIRPVQLSDVPVVFAVIHDAYVEYKGKLTPPSGAHNETVASLNAKLSHGKGALAWRGDVAIGSVLFEPRGTAMYLGRLAVPPIHRGQGIGAALVSYVEMEAMRCGHTRVTLGVRLQLPQNAAFYTKLGYDIVSYGSHPGFMQPTYMTMEKPLAQ